MSNPTASSMKFKFPEFRSVDDGIIEFAIEEAMVACGNGKWIDEINQTLGITYYAAHLLQLSILRAQQSSSGQTISSERTPDMSITYATTPQPTGDETTDLTTTPYGMRFKDLVTKNFPAILTVGSAVRM